MHDVVIVGAGPAGSVAARELSEKGFDVVLLEKCSYPGEKNVCAGAISERGVKEFSIPKEVFLREIYTISLYSPLNEVISETRKKRFGITTDRKILDKKLSELAVDAGAELLTSARVDRVIFKDRKPAGVEYHHKGNINTIEADMIIGADGVNSTVAKTSGLRSVIPPETVAIGVEYEIESPSIETQIGDAMEIYIGSKIAPLGYGWVFAKEESHATVGIGSLLSEIKSPGRCLEGFVKTHEVVQKKIKGFTIKEKKASLLPSGGEPWDETHLDNLLLIGDAGWLCSPVTGEGIYFAMKSARIAARIVEKALEEENTSEGFLKKYQGQWKTEFGNDFRWGLHLRKIIFGSDSSANVLFSRAKENEEVGNLAIAIVIGEIAYKEALLKGVKELLPYLILGKLNGFKHKFTGKLSSVKHTLFS